MTLKDWRKDYTNKFIYDRWKNIKSHIILEVLKDKNKWLFHVAGLKGFVKYFKTKSQTLKFAKSYMRKH